MKVRINSAVDLNDVPNKIFELFTQLHKESQVVSEASRDALDASKVSSNSALKYKLLLEMTNGISSSLQDVADTIADVKSIVGGYINLLEPPEEANTPVSQPATTPEKTAGEQ